MIKEAEFDYEGRRLTIRAALDNNEVKVRVFEGGEQVCPTTYSATVETIFDATVSGFPVEIIDGLMALAEQDVLNQVVPVAAKKSN